MQQSGTNKVIAGIIIIVAIALIAVAASALTKKEDQQTAQQNDTTMQESMSTMMNSNATYRDGTYTIDDTYPSPGGEEDIKVVLTLKDNLVTAVDVTQEANQRESAEFQGQFQQGYKSRVIGKAINALQLDRVSGSSLTTQAFDDALEQIRSQAEV